MNEKKILSLKDILILIFSVLIIIFQCIIMYGQFTHECKQEDNIKTELILRDHINYAHSDNDDTLVNTYDYSYLYFNVSLTSSELISSLSSLESYSANYDDTYYAWFNTSNYLRFDSLVNSQWNIVLCRNGIETIIYQNGNWNLPSNPVPVNFTNGLEDISLNGVNVPVGEVNNFITDVVSPIPFLFQGNYDYEFQSSGLSNGNEYIYFNNTLTSKAIKDNFDTFVGTNFTYNIGVYDVDNDVTHTLTISNTSDNSYIKFDSTYFYRYNWFNYTDTWFTGINPSYLVNNIIFFANDITFDFPVGLDVNDFDFILSSQNDFVLKTFTYQDILDAYNRGQDEGYREGYNKGLEDGESSSTGGYDTGFQDGKNSVINNPNANGLYNQNQYDSNYDKGFNAGVQSVPAGIDENGFKILFNSILNAPYNIFNGILNFELFGVNVFNLLSFVFTISIIGFVVKLLLTK